MIYVIGFRIFGLGYCCSCLNGGAIALAVNLLDAGGHCSIKADDISRLEEGFFDECRLLLLLMKIPLGCRLDKNCCTHDGKGVW